jgi:signal transduction histidine kinase
VNHGKQRHRLGFQINDAAEGFGMVCDSIAEVAVRHRLNVSARELQLVNLCVDSAVSAAISEYWEASRVEHEQRVTERIGFLVHELRNSLSVASMAYRIVRQGRVGLASQTADAVERSLQRMERLVGEATAAIQLESRARPAREPLHLRSLVEEAQGAVPLGREVSLHFDVPEDLTVLGDASLLGSALANLLQNAGKFSRPAGTVVVRGLQNEIEVVLEIEDECGGLPEGDTSELFRPFSQRSDDKSGLGLGLSIAREAALVHGGRIDVRNLPGKGCVFSLAIPKRS